MLYTQYAYPLELAAMVLLVAIIAAISLTMRRRAGLQAAGHQRAGGGAAPEDRVRIVKMDPEKRP